MQTLNDLAGFVLWLKAKGHLNDNHAVAKLDEKKLIELADEYWEMAHGDEHG